MLPANHSKRRHKIATESLDPECTPKVHQRARTTDDPYCTERLSDFNVDVIPRRSTHTTGGLIGTEDAHLKDSRTISDGTIPLYANRISAACVRNGALNGERNSFHDFNQKDRQANRQGPSQHVLSPCSIACEMQLAP